MGAAALMSFYSARRRHVEVSRALESNAPHIPKISVLISQYLEGRITQAAPMDGAAQISASVEACWYICPCNFTHILIC